MRVCDLIEKLQGLDPELPVVIADDLEIPMGEWVDIEEVEITPEYVELGPVKHALASRL